MGSALRRATAVAALMLAGCGSGHHRAAAARDGASAPGPVTVVQTTRDLAERLSPRPSLRFRAGVPRGVPLIRIDASVREQRVTGVGAAMTDTSAWLLADELPPATRAAVMARLFTPRGIGLAVVRIPIAASDFTRTGRPYSYDDVPPGHADPTLARFSIAHDDAYILPLLRQMLALDPSVETLASPWSPPPWMKRNDRFDNRAESGALRPGMEPVLAAYLVRFLEAYRAAGVPIDALTPQNEPGQPSLYPGLNLSEAEEGRFIVTDLVPALHAAGLHPRLYAHDFKWLYLGRVLRLVSDRRVRADLAGIAWHCYEGDPAVMSTLHRAAPALDQIETECSGGLAPGPAAEAVIASLRNWASAVLVWNLALDRQGGPVEPPNLGCPHCTGLVTVDKRTHTVSYGIDYYELGQFGRFVAPGAYRIASNTLVTYTSPTIHDKVDWARPGVDDVALENPDGTLVLLAHNNAARTEPFAVAWRGRSFDYALPAGATVTFRWQSGSGGSPGA